MGKQNLRGLRVWKVRYMSDKELSALAWPAGLNVPVVVLEDGTKIFSSCADQPASLMALNEDDRFTLRP